MTPLSYRNHCIIQVISRLRDKSCLHINFHSDAKLKKNTCIIYNQLRIMDTQNMHVRAYACAHRSRVHTLPHDSITVDLNSATRSLMWGWVKGIDKKWVGRSFSRLAHAIISTLLFASATLALVSPSITEI